MNDCSDLSDWRQDAAAFGLDHPQTVYYFTRIMECYRRRWLQEEQEADRRARRRYLWQMAALKAFTLAVAIATGYLIARS